MRSWQVLSILVLVGATSISLSAIEEAVAKSKSKKQLGKETYLSSCEACHMMGKNVIKPGKDIVTSSKLVDIDTFRVFLSESHGVMPAFKQLADSPELLEALYKFSKTLKNQNWQYTDKVEEEPGPAPEKRAKNRKGKAGESPMRD